MQRTELVKRLRKGGYSVKPGGKHGKAIHPDCPEKAIPVPNGSKINDFTAKGILKEAGLL
ncbi:MAG: type II toxin-antitoxin system HicA family toxin [Defluviitaleaceae bacterium]|nr:type II toxin-antitoxin system HicA family toxin [Defluviitaleaceae bacterium]